VSLTTYLAATVGGACLGYALTGAPIAAVAGALVGLVVVLAAQLAS
jgi:hypothetical protein